jgi:hypothetical protein
MARENKTKSRYFWSQNVKMAKNNTRPNYARSQVRCGQDVNNWCKLIADWLKLAKLYKLVAEWLCANIRSRHVCDSIYICFADTKTIQKELWTFKIIYLPAIHEYVIKVITDKCKSSHSWQYCSISWKAFTMLDCQVWMDSLSRAGIDRRQMTALTVSPFSNVATSSLSWSVQYVSRLLL